MKIRKSEGFTPTEKLLSSLCENTFFELFSYLNPVREDGKELCDLIAVFEDHVFIFFDRESRKFATDAKDVSVTWKRWEKEVIDKQIRALGGAEKYIRTGKSIFLDPKRKTRLPVTVTEDAIVHKFIIAHGAAEAWESLIQNPGLPRSISRFSFNLKTATRFIFWTALMSGSFWENWILFPTSHRL